MMGGKKKRKIHFIGRCYSISRMTNFSIPKLFSEKMHFRQPRLNPESFSYKWGGGKWYKIVSWIEIIHDKGVLYIQWRNKLRVTSALAMPVTAMLLKVCTCLVKVFLFYNHSCKLLPGRAELATLPRSYLDKIMIIAKYLYNVSKEPLTDVGIIFVEYFKAKFLNVSRYLVVVVMMKVIKMEKFWHLS